MNYRPSTATLTRPISLVGSAKCDLVPPFNSSPKECDSREINTNSSSLPPARHGGAVAPARHTWQLQRDKSGARRRIRRCWRAAHPARAYTQHPRCAAPIQARQMKRPCTGTQWFCLPIDSTNGNILFGEVEFGRIYDSSETNAWWYCMPSLMVNDRNDVAIGCSGARPTDYIGAFCTWRRSGVSSFRAPVMIRSGTAEFNSTRFGDYSYTSLDPSDRVTFWTVQQYAKVTQLHPAYKRWGTWISRLSLSP